MPPISKPTNVDTSRSGGGYIRDPFLQLLSGETISLAPEPSVAAVPLGQVDPARAPSVGYFEQAPGSTDRSPFEYLCARLTSRDPMLRIHIGQSLTDTLALQNAIQERGGPINDSTKAIALFNVITAGVAESPFLAQEGYNLLLNRLWRDPLENYVSRSLPGTLEAQIRTLEILTKSTDLNNDTRLYVDLQLGICLSKNKETAKSQQLLTETAQGFEEVMMYPEAAAAYQHIALTFLDSGNLELAQLHVDLASSLNEKIMSQFLGSSEDRRNPDHLRYPRKSVAIEGMILHCRAFKEINTETAQELYCAAVDKFAEAEEMLHQHVQYDSDLSDPDKEKLGGISGIALAVLLLDLSTCTDFSQITRGKLSVDPEERCQIMVDAEGPNRRDSVVNMRYAEILRSLVLAKKTESSGSCPDLCNSTDQKIDQLCKFGMPLTWWYRMAKGIVSGNHNLN